MNDLNVFIATADKFTTRQDAMPVVDRSPHVDVGMEMARRASERRPEPIYAPMPAIVPVAN